MVVYQFEGEAMNCRYRKTCEKAFNCVAAIDADSICREWLKRRLKGLRRATKVERNNWDEHCDQDIYLTARIDTYNRLLKEIGE